MFEFHSDKERYFDYQYRTARDYILPFVQPHLNYDRPWRVLEIGCAEAGVLKAFLERGDHCFGIDLAADRIALARHFHQEALAMGQIDFLVRNIYDIDVERDLPHRFDLILLKDVIEHIPEQHVFLDRLRTFLAPGGFVFFAFPPWQMPFGGHQQICRNKVLALLPYYHLLPRPLYRGILKAAGEPEHTIRELLELKETGLSIEHFERILEENRWQTVARKYFLINPIYQYKFNLEPREQAGFINRLPGVRNFLTTCAYYLTGVRSEE